MRAAGYACLGLTVASMATVVGVPTFLAVRCHTHPEGTKAIATQTYNNIDIKCPLELRENGDVYGGTLPRRKMGHIFRNGTALDQDGLFKGKATENGELYLAYLGIDNIDSFINSTEGKPHSSDADLGVKATAVVDGKGDVYKDVSSCDKWGKNCVTNSKKMATIEQKSDNVTKVEKNAMGLFFIA